MNKMKLITLIGVAALTAGAFAGPRHHGGFRGGPRFGHRPPVVHHHHGWGHSHHGFWPGFVGGVVGGIVGGVVVDTIVAPTPTTVVTTPTTIVTTPPVVVTQPAPVTTVQNVWVEGRYVDQIQPNGTTVRVWQPGHYEQRTIGDL